MVEVEIVLAAASRLINQAFAAHVTSAERSFLLRPFPPAAAADLPWRGSAGGPGRKGSNRGRGLQLLAPPNLAEDPVTPPETPPPPARSRHHRMGPPLFSSSFAATVAS